GHRLQPEALDLPRTAGAREPHGRWVVATRRAQGRSRRADSAELSGVRDRLPRRPETWRRGSQRRSAHGSGRPAHAYGVDLATRGDRPGLAGAATHQRSPRFLPGSLRVGHAAVVPDAAEAAWIPDQVVARARTRDGFGRARDLGEAGG